MTDDDHLTGAQVAEMFGVTARTVHRWSEVGLLPYSRTPGGHRRYPRKAIEAAVTKRDDLTLASPRHG